MSTNPTTPSAAGGPLTGFRVIDLTQFVLGPIATQILGDYGADVIKVEAPGGDLNRSIGPARHPGMAALFLGMNRNKRSVVLNLRKPEALEALKRMVETADVLVHSMRPPAAERLGVGYAAVSARNPGIVYASAPGYRPDGPYRDRPAYDDVIQGESGIAGITELATGEPRYLPIVIADKFCGHILASSIGMALVHRARTGEGQQVQVPMLETMMSFNLIEHLFMGAFDPPLGPLGYDRALMPYRRPFKTKDSYVCLMATSDAQWQGLFKAFDRPELCEDARFGSVAERSKRFPELYQLVADQMQKRTTAEWQVLLDAAGIPNGVARKLQDLPSDPYLVETGFFHHYVHPQAGAMVTTSIPVHFSRTPGQIKTPPPTLGEHSHEILSAMGYGEADIAHMSS
ncbi:MAG: CoA transferase [Burkholderiales bacterium]|nr:CoA transferase [Burkholderiales bacterium]